MVRTGAPAEEADPSRLFAPPVRWGYEYVEPVPRAQSPERATPPSRRAVRTVPRAQASGLVEAAALAAVGGVGALILDSELGVLSSGGVKGTAATVAFGIGHSVAAFVAFWAARAWQRSSSKENSPVVIHWIRRNLVPAVNALAAFSAPYLVLPVEAVVAWRRVYQGRFELAPHPGDARRAEGEYRDATSAWEKRIAQFEAAEAARFDSVDLWYPVPMSGSYRMTCVFGGTPVSWTAALATLGSSLLGSGARIVIGDLSRRLTADVLCNLCRTVGAPVVEAVLPDHAAGADLFAEVSWNDLSTVLVEVLHSAQQDLDISLRERQEDRSVIREVAECLDTSGPVSIARLRSALLVIQREEIAGNGAAAIDADECDRLRGLFNEVQRQHGGVMERVTRIERALRGFEVLDGADQGDSGAGQGNSGGGQGDSGAGQGDSGGGQGDSGGGRAAAIERSPLVSGDYGDLRVIGIDKQTDDLENDRLVDLLFQLLLRRVRQGWAQADVLVILGADRIRRKALESLITHAEQERIGVLLFFEHLRQDAIEIVGAGGAAAAFLALGNHREAKEASDFIGAAYKWVEAQHTASASESLTQTPGREESASTTGTLGLSSGISMGRTKTKGRSYSEAFGQSREYAVGEQRVREAVVEPEVLMGLPVTGMICVEVLPGGRRIAANIDCHPQIVFAPRVAEEPRPSPHA